MDCTPNQFRFRMNGVGYNDSYSSVVKPKYHKSDTNKYPKVPHKSGDTFALRYCFKTHKCELYHIY